jgi:hypothetical protein
MTRFQAQWAYDASGPGEMSMKEGDIMILLSDEGDWLNVYVCVRKDNTASYFNS